jgi:hypothetical protein
MHHRRPHSTTAHSERLEQLAAAIDAYRGNKPRRRLSPGLRAQVVTAIDAGATVRAVREACKLSATQIGRWRQAAALSGDDAVSSSGSAEGHADVDRRPSSSLRTTGSAGGSR